MVLVLVLVLVLVPVLVLGWLGSARVTPDVR
ncbi:hypothetical protein JOF44_002527 [Brachybacterium fresconis]|uniref:Uncharacterized protein n=1 Tax=Brachybacterium fresconis TaxID=173363 RepID=A0ABS4YLK3_9MICO|nr:hypothetical protein [Brachybacterium fresconis]